MRQLLRATTLGALALLAASAQAQFPGPPGDFRTPPGGQAWQRWHDTHRNVLAVGRTLAGLEAIERDPPTRLTRAQAKNVLAVIGAWHGRPVMTDAQAQRVNRQLTAALTAAQVRRIAAIPRRGGPPPGDFRGGPGGPPLGGGWGGPPPGGPHSGGFGGHRGGRPAFGGGPGGPPPGGGFSGGPGGPPGGGFGGFRPRDFNPLDPSSGPFQRGRPARRDASRTSRRP